MKSLALCLMLAAFPVCADDANKKNCEAAVDAADSMNVNRQECDYSNEGLNGFLQKAFKKGEEGAVISTAPEQGATTGREGIEPGVQANASPQKATGKQFILHVIVDQWANLPVARAQLLPKALEQCGQGFAIVSEQYRSLGMGKIELGLGIQCD